MQFKKNLFLCIIQVIIMFIITKLLSVNYRRTQCPHFSTPYIQITQIYKLKKIIISYNLIYEGKTKYYFNFQ